VNSAEAFLERIAPNLNPSRGDAPQKLEKENRVLGITAGEQAGSPRSAENKTMTSCASGQVTLVCP